MTNPTSNFGWQMPTSTDLVTDLPADFEVFGQAVDTSLADLKGGTTGQVLAKASNANMDFVWTADASGIPASAFTAKGVLLVGTGVSTYQSQTVGTNGQVLTADSAESDGVKWATPTSPAPNWALISTTTINTGTSYSITGLSGYNQLLIRMQGISATTADIFGFRLNNVSTGSKYLSAGIVMVGNAAYQTTMFQGAAGNAVNNFGDIGTSTAAATMGGYLLLQGANSSNLKVGTLAIGANNNDSGSNFQVRNLIFDDTNVISSFQINTNFGNFDAGTITIYGSTN
jgi:hypothetical protein